jgi:hypothetical protein
MSGFSIILIKYAENYHAFSSVSLTGGAILLTRILLTAALHLLFKEIIIVTEKEKTTENEGNEGDNMVERGENEQKKKDEVNEDVVYDESNFPESDFTEQEFRSGFTLNNAYSATLSLFGSELGGHFINEGSKVLSKKNYVCFFIFLSIFSFLEQKIRMKKREFCSFFPLFFFFFTE